MVRLRCVPFDQIGVRRPDRTGVRAVFTVDGACHADAAHQARHLIASHWREQRILPSATFADTVDTTIAANIVWTE